MTAIAQTGTIFEDGTYEIEEVADDPFVARFLSPDPVIQSPGNAQNYNRYSYALNNPLKYTDPSGYMFRGSHQPINPGGYVDHGFRNPLGRIAPGSGNNWSDAYGPMMDDFIFMSEKSFNAKYGIKDEYDDADTDNNTSGDVEFTLTGVDAQAFFEEVIDGMSIYMISAFGQNTLVSSFGDFGSINISEDGGIGFTNFSVVGAHLFTLEVGNRRSELTEERFSISEKATLGTAVTGGSVQLTTELVDKLSGAVKNVDMVKFGKSLTRKFGYAGVTITAIDALSDRSFSPGDGVRIFLSGATFIPYAGWAYGAVDMGVLLVTGTSATDRIGVFVDDHWGSGPK